MYIFLLLLLLLSLILKITFDKEKIAKSLKTLESIEQKASKQIDRINADEKKSGNNSGFLSKFKKKEKKIINGIYIFKWFKLYKKRKKCFIVYISKIFIVYFNKQILNTLN